MTSKVFNIKYLIFFSPSNSDLLFFFSRDKKRSYCSVLSSKNSLHCANLVLTTVAITSFLSKRTRHFFRNKTFQQDMVFTAADKAIIQHYHEKGYTPYRIWKENPEKKWNKPSMYRLIVKFVDLPVQLSLALLFDCFD